MVRDARVERETVLGAVASDSIEGDIQVARTRHAWTDQIALLERVGNERNRDQEMLLRQLRRNVRDLDTTEAERHATPQGLGMRRLSAFGPVGGGGLGFLSAFSGVKIWMVLAAGWAVTGGALAVQGALKERIENQRDNAREERDRAEQALTAAQETQRVLAAAVQAADAQTAQTARTIEVERARRVRAEREARSVRNAISEARAGGPIDYGFGGVRDAGAPAPRSGDNLPTPGDSG